jgi:hypothetical protein
MSKYKYMPIYYENEQAPLAGDHPPFYIPKGNPIPGVVDLGQFFGPIGNQGELGSCTAWSSLAWYNAWRVKKGGQWTDYSELAQYWEERNLEGTVDSDSGAALFDAWKVFETLGVMLEKDDPYIIQNFRNKPPEDKFIKGSQLPADLVKQIDPARMLEHTLDALANGYPVLFGFYVFPELEGDYIKQTGILTLPTPDERSLGGHAVVAIGYDQNKQMLKIRNSWGEMWGDHGHFWMPFEFYQKYAFTAYIIEDGEYTPPQPQPTPQPMPQPQPNPRPQPAPQPEKLYRVQVGAFKDPKNAQELLEELKAKGFNGYIKYE